MCAASLYLEISRFILSACMLQEQIQEDKTAETEALQGELDEQVCRQQHLGLQEVTCSGSYSTLE